MGSTSCSSGGVGQIVLIAVGFWGSSIDFSSCKVHFADIV
jgi:hypothetical protein